MRELVEGVAVIGGGVAGFTLAAALRARKLPVELAGVRAAGPDRNLHLWPGALAALERIGLLDPVVRQGTALERLRLSSSSGRTLVDLDARQLSGGGIGCLTIRASAFLEVLQAACAGVPAHLGRRVIGYAEDELWRHVHLRGRLAAARAGRRRRGRRQSRVRTQCLDDGPPQYSGDSVWEGIGPRPASYAHAPAALDLIWGADGSAPESCPSGSTVARWHGGSTSRRASAAAASQVPENLSSVRRSRPWAAPFATSSRRRPRPRSAEPTCIHGAGSGSRAGAASP